MCTMKRSGKCLIESNYARKAFKCFESKATAHSSRTNHSGIEELKLSMFIAQVNPSTPSPISTSNLTKLLWTLINVYVPSGKSFSVLTQVSFTRSLLFSLRRSLRLCITLPLYSKHPRGPMFVNKRTHASKLASIFFHSGHQHTLPEHLLFEWIH